MDLASSIDNVKGAFAGVNGWDVLFAVLSLVVAWIAGRLARRAVLGALSRLEGVGRDLRQLAGRLTKYLVYAVGVGVALAFLGASLQPILAAVVIVGVVMVLALRGIADNFASGIVLQTRRPVQLGDEIETLGHVGVVRDMNGRSVILETYDGRTVHIPNSKVLSNPLVNNSAHGSRCTEIEVRATRNAGIDSIVEVVSGAADVEGVLRDPAPVVFVAAAEPERVIIRLRVWREPSHPQLGSRVVSSVAEALRGRHIDAAVMTPPPKAPTTPSAPL